MIRAMFTFIVACLLFFPVSAQAWEAFFLEAMNSETLLVTPLKEKTFRVVRVRLYGIDASTLKKKDPETIRLAFQEYLRRGDVVTIIPLIQYSKAYEASIVFHNGLVLNIEWLRRNWAKIREIDEY